MKNADLSLKGRALCFLSRREYSYQELVEKLRPYASSEDELQIALQQLQVNGFINEVRLIDSVVNSKAGRFGELRLKQIFRQKALNAENQEKVKEALIQLRETELERARNVWQRKFDTPPKDQKERLKQMRFLAGRGFSPEVIKKLFHSSPSQDDAL